MGFDMELDFDVDLDFDVGPFVDLLGLGPGPGVEGEPHDRGWTRTRAGHTICVPGTYAHSRRGRSVLLEGMMEKRSTRGYDG